MKVALNRETGNHPSDLFSFFCERQSRGVRCAIVTIVDLIGSSSRQLGSHMIVCEGGQYAGSVSSGCFDASIVAFAQIAIAENRQMRIKLGEGSPYLDVKLPCGGGLELLIEPVQDAGIIGRIAHELKQRNSCGCTISTDGFKFDPTVNKTGWYNDVFHIAYKPKLKIFAGGHGAELIAMAQISLASGFDVVAASPDEDELVACENYGAISQHLTTTSDDLFINADAWTAIVLLFHDHDWEPSILVAGLQTAAFYIGALGSQQTHASRLETLRSINIPEDQLKRIHGPIGLVPAMRNASMLAISALAEIIEKFNRKGGGESC